MAAYDESKVRRFKEGFSGLNTEFTAQVTIINVIPHDELKMDDGVVLHEAHTAIDGTFPNGAHASITVPASLVANFERDEPGDDYKVGDGTITDQDFEEAREFGTDAGHYTCLEISGLEKNR